MTWSVYSAVGSADIRPTALLAGLRAWAEEADVVPGGEGPEPHFQVALCGDPRGGAWLTFSEPRGDGALNRLRELARVAARVSGHTLWVMISGAEDGSQSHTVLGYHAVSVDPDGGFNEHSHEGAEAYLSEVNPVSDDCPYEEFSALLDALVGGELLEELAVGNDGEALECPGEFSSIRFTEDDRLNGLIVAARGGATFEVEPQSDGRTLLKVCHCDGMKQVAYLNAGDAEIFGRALKR